MLIAAIYDEKGKKVKDMRIPQVEDMLFSQACLLDHGSVEIGKWMKDEVGKRQYRARMGMKVAELLCGIFEWEMDEIAHLPIGNEDNVADVNTLLGLWYYLLGVMHGYKPQQNWDSKHGMFEHKGEVYRMPNIRKNTVLNKEMPSSLTVQQLVEASTFEMSYSRLARNIDNMDPEEVTIAGKQVEKYYAKAKEDFLARIKMIALLSAEAEEIPQDEAAFNRWIDERYLNFVDIPMTTAFDINFFLYGL